MPKPKKDRFVLKPPSVVYFKPQGIPLSQLEQVVLGVDEYEVIRLVDYEGLYQQAAAEKMKISRATCARILESAHKKIAQALTNGQAIRIEGGNFILGRNRFRCRDCNTHWEISLSGGSLGEFGVVCPSCKSEKVQDLGRELGLQSDHRRPGQKPAGHRHGSGRGRGGSGLEHDKQS